MSWNKLLSIVLAVSMLANSTAVPLLYAQTSSSAQFKVYPLGHVSPGEARRMLVELLGNNASDSRIIADQQRQELLVSGSAEVHQLAAQLMKQLNQPRPSAAPVKKEPTVLRSYSCPPSYLKQCSSTIEELLGQSGRISVDANRAQIIVVATQAHQKLIRQIVTRYSVNAKSVKENATKPLFPVQSRFRAQSVMQNQTEPEIISKPEVVSSEPRCAIAIPATYQFQNITGMQCQRALTKLLGKNLTRISDQRFTFTLNSLGTVLLEFNSQAKSCLVDGPKSLASQLVILVQKLDESQSRQVGESVRFVPLQNVNPDVLQQAIQLWRESSQDKTASQKEQSQYSQPQNNIQQVAFFQEASAAQQGSTIQQGSGEGDSPLKRPSSDVTVEALPDLDLLILRGRDPDIEELTRIIREIEKLSDETAPQIEVFHLKHVQGEALNTLIDKVLQDLTGPLQGRISITPLVKPNALLLIGWGEAVKAAKKLIAELDQPVMTETQMQIFALKNAPAQEVQTTIEQFLNGRGGLGPEVNVTANLRTNSVIVNASPRDMQEVAELVAQLDVGTSKSVKQAKLIQLKNSLATNVAQTITTAIAAAKGGTTGKRNAALEMLMVGPNGKQMMTSGLLDDVTLTPDVRTNSIFITGPLESLPLVEQLIHTLDESPRDSAQIKIFHITNGDASDMVALLRTLFPTAGVSTVPQLATAEGETTLVPVRFSVDVRTNNIIATGTSGDLKIVEALMLRLDQTESEERINRVFKLKNSPANDVARAVNEFLRSERIVAQAAPGRQNAFQQIEQEVVVVAEPVGNSLIISATPRYFEQIVELVESLDEQPPQVMIQIIIAEVQLDNLHEFGIELGLQDSLLFDRSLLGDLLTTTSSTSLSTPGGVISTTQDNIVGATNTPGYDFNNNPLGNSGSTQALAGKGNVGGQGLSNFSLGRVNGDLDYGGLVLSASSANVSVLLRALEQSKSLEILSRPQVMTLDNQPAFIQVGQRVPRIVGTQLNQIGQVNNIQMENVGLILGVTPRISPDGNVVMEIDAEKSEIGPEQEGIPVSVSAEGSIIRSPRVNIITAQTSVSAASGQTIVIGGLITSSNTSFTRQVPWLGSLPVVGKLFRFDSTSNARKELLIILTPHIVRNENEAEYIKQLEVSRISWVTSDVFNWLEGGGDISVPKDDSGIDVIYPDDDPGAESIRLQEPGKLPPQKHSQQQLKHPEDRKITPLPVPAATYSQPTGTSPRLPMVPAEKGRGGGQ